MSQAENTPKANEPATVASERFRNMSPLRKLTYIGKALLFVLSLGFIYPNTFSD